MISVERTVWNRLKISAGKSQPMKGDRSVSREHLAEIFAEVGYKYGAEIGVFRGDYSQVLCEKIPGLKLLCVDPWSAYMGKSPRRMEKIYRTTRDRLKKYNVEILRMTSVNAAGVVPNSSLDFVYIDGMHEFDYIMADIILWEPKVRYGGVVAGHDYTSPYRGWGVKQATHAYVKGHGIPNWYVLVDTNEWSWFWVKRKYK